VSNSTTSSAASEDENLLSDDDDEEQVVEDADDDVEDDEDESLDVNHYALSPWATAPPSVLAGARLRGSRHFGSTRRTVDEAGLTSSPPSSSASLLLLSNSRSERLDSLGAAGAGVDSTKEGEKPRSRTNDGEQYDGSGDSGREDSWKTTAMVLDPESSVLQIGELASRPSLTNPKGIRRDDNNNNDDEVDEEGHVEIAVQGLDSMMIGHTESAMDVDEEDMENFLAPSSQGERDIRRPLRAAHGSTDEKGGEGVIPRQERAKVDEGGGGKGGEGDEERGGRRHGIVDSATPTTLVRSQNHNKQQTNQHVQEQQIGETTSTMTATKQLPSPPSPDSGLPLDNDLSQHQQQQQQQAQGSQNQREREGWGESSDAIVM